ncbi:hypothetical protein BIT28_09355 [Photobacterium proteolyticum]|uniref:Uncharacterized protein n=1 Tax=Photobacterium proteolyticum TaxID=1903952 RepID=A0A1Q9GIT9_9GAMM|nr:hypothetical protein [Photobacterium proteolyticum]OLQ74369.1 hypothetical protein BIT28_09355 [Photobacterium proteolyticum]
MHVRQFQSSILGLITAFFVIGCSSTSESFFSSSEYRFHDSTQSFIALNDTRRNGAVVDKGLFYPKSAFSFTYRYCANSQQEANNDIQEFHQLTKRVCDANVGDLIHQDTGTWCVYNPNSVDERPIFYSRISSTALWADLCLDGPFVTLKVIENTEASPDEWYDAAKILGYQPYSPYRKLLTPPEVGQIPQPIKEPVATDLWNEESEYIYTNIGSVVCLYNRPKDSAIGYTYLGTVHSVGNGLVKVAATAKLKGDIRTAPTLEQLEWHRMAYITAAVNSWFVCG